MSDDPKDIPPAKLKLSRDLKAPDDANAPKPPPSMKLRRKEPEDSAKESVPNPPQNPLEESPEAEVESKPEHKSGFDPKKPFGDAIKEGEIKSPASPPHNEAEPMPPPQADSEGPTGAQVEAAVNALNGSQDDDTRSKSSLLPSLLTLLLLFIVLGGAGYGLWILLKTPDEASATTASETESTSETAKKGPIQKAKEAIAKVPVADVAAITGGSEPDAKATEPAEAMTAQTVENTFQPEPPTPALSVEASKQSVSQYLSSIHVGGARKGDRPMILIDGESFQAGEIVHPETGLKFDGWRDGRLAFRDSHGIVYLKSF